MFVKSKLKIKKVKQNNPKEEKDRGERFNSNGAGVLFFANESDYLAYKKANKENK